MSDTWQEFRRQLHILTAYVLEHGQETGNISWQMAEGAINGLEAVYSRLRESSSAAWRFDCPVHGEESEVYCFRAFDPVNKHLWHKYQIIQTAVEFSKDERDGVLKKLTERYIS